MSNSSAPKGLIHDSFRRTEHPNGTVVFNYSYMDNEVFPAFDAHPFARIARELRGLTFDGADGRLLSRPYHKFFNAGEREEVLAEKLPFARSHAVLEKLDGSMIHAFVAPDGELTFATRGGVSDHARSAYGWYAGNDASGAGRAAMRRLWEEGWTPIFEWLSPETIIVVRHEEPGMVLTGLRQRESGAYASADELRHHAEAMRLPAVRALDPVGDWETFAREVFHETEGEGYVVRFASGHMVKVKNALYARVHKFKSRLTMEKDAAEIVLSGSADDVLPHLQPHERAMLEEYRHGVLRKLREASGRVDAAIAEATSSLGGCEPRERQKRFWLEYAAPLGKQLASIAAIVWSGKASSSEALAAFALRETATIRRYDSVATALDLPRWSYSFDGDT